MASSSSAQIFVQWPTPEPMPVITNDGVMLWTFWNRIKQKHSIECDICSVIVDAGRNGHGTRILTHRDSTECKKQCARLGRPTYVPTYDRPSTSNPQECPGAGFRWPAESFWDTYPYQNHKDRDTGWLPSGFDSEKNIIYIRATKCTKTLVGQQPCCKSCIQIVNSAPFRKMIIRSTMAEPPPTMRHDYLNHFQLAASTRQHAAEKRVLSSQLKAALRRERRLKHRCNDYEKIVQYLSQRDIPRLRWVFAAALKRGVRPERLLTLLQRAADGVYRAHGHDKFLLDVSFLASELGGPRLLFALGRSHGLLSKRTIRRRLNVPRVLVSIALPTKDEIDTNISSFLDPEVAPLPVPLSPSTSLPGHIAMFDGVALEPKACYCSRRDCVIGLSRETAGKVDTSASTMENVDLIRIALHEKRVKFGSEATVLAIAPYADDTHYTPVPLVASPSDKSEKADVLARWLGTTLDCWKTHDNGQKTRGPIWSLGSDGDSTYRLAKHTLCSKGRLSGALRAQLSPLHGFNLQSSADGQTTWTCDPKHIIKRFATLLRNRQGIIVSDSNITPQDILTHLTTLGGLSPEQAVQLLDPADKQNVPKAVNLMQQLHGLSVRATAASAAGLNPTQLRGRNALLAFSRILWYFVEPFINVEMSLSQQLESLSAFVHCANILQVRHGSAALTGALFADTGATVKNIFTVVARLKLLNPSYLFYLLLEGTDRLEQVFSEVRTLDHARNFDIDQLSSKLSSAFLIHAVFQRNPQLDRGHRRLELINVMGIDRLNPKSWKGNVSVGSVDLAEVWSRGRARALQHMRRFGSSMTVDFDELFRKTDCDILRPQGQYVGIGATPGDDRSELPESEITPHIPRAPERDLPLVDIANTEFDEPAHAAPSTENELARDLHAMGVLPNGINVDDYFPDALSAGSDDEVGSAESPADSIPLSKTFTDSKGRKVWKSAYIAALSGDTSKKVTLRTLRVQGVALSDLHAKSTFEPYDESIIHDPDMVKSGDLMGFLARVGESYAFSVLEVKGFTLSGGDTSVSMSMEKFEEARSATDVCVFGQVLDLREADDGSRWFWTGDYLHLDGDTDGRVAHGSLLVSVPVAFAQPVSPELFESNSQDRATLAPPLTWAFQRQGLVDAVEEAWQVMDPNSEEMLTNMTLLPTIKNTRKLPYRAKNGSKCFVVPRVPVHLTPEPKHSGKEKVNCYLCETAVGITGMREHVGRHILLAFRGLKDPLREGKPPLAANPCGFCGRETCLTVLTVRKGNRKSKILSSCGYQHEKMKYNTAAQSSQTNPCSNVPIHCPLCPVSKSGAPRTIWRYNAVPHALKEHDSADPDTPTSLARRFEYLKATHISLSEEAALLNEHFDEAATRQFRSEHTIPNSDGFEIPPDTTAAPTGTTRARGDTTESERADQPPFKRLATIQQPEK